MFINTEIQFYHATSLKPNTILTCQCNFSQLRGAGLGCGEVVGRAEEEHVGRRRRLHRRVQEH